MDEPHMTVRRVTVYVPPHDGWPETKRGVASVITCGKCGATLRGRTHAEARHALLFHGLDKHSAEPGEAASPAREKEGS